MTDHGRVAAPPARIFDAARDMGLDFVALTDHNTVSHWLEVDRLQPLYAPLLLLRGRELTTYRGHATVIGESAFHDFRLPSPVTSPAAVLDAVTADGAFVSINHPMLPDDEGCMGCGWNDTDAGTVRHVRGVEVVNGDATDLAAWRFWAARLNQGAHLAAVGGSDDHTPGETADRTIGRPATVVYADNLSERAIVAGLRAGRTYVRVTGPTGPGLELFAAQSGQRVGLGGELAPGPAVLTVSVKGAGPWRVEWIRNGDVMQTTALPDTGQAIQPCVLSAGDWVSVIVRDAAGHPALFSSAIYTAR